MPENFKNFIGGEWVAPSTGAYFENRNPADRADVIGCFPRSGPDDVQRAVAATPSLPPGMQIKSRGGQFAKVCVGTSPSPQSLGTGAADFATIWVADRGSRESTCRGPVKSSWVRSGKMTKPILNSGILSPYFGGS